jgi:hypothetical protein
MHCNKAKLGGAVGYDTGHHQRFGGARQRHRLKAGGAVSVEEEGEGRAKIDDQQCHMTCHQRGLTLSLTPNPSYNRAVRDMWRPFQMR